MANSRAAVRVTGRVQGVWFRQSTKQTAESHNLTGWVRNNPDGSVSAVFEGEEQAVQALVEWCKEGPRLALVDNVDVEWSDYRGEFSCFDVR